MTTPRVFIIRHGETEWSLNGRHTGTTDIPLTPAGERRILATGKALVGPDRLIVPHNLAHIYVSPRRRAQRTLDLLGLAGEDPMPWHSGGGAGGGGKEVKSPHGPLPNDAPKPTRAKVEVVQDVCEWDYGDYEGITSREIAEQREKNGLPEWDIWRDGCPGGESPSQITQRLDRLIADIRTRFHAPAIGRPKGGVSEPFDVLIVAHGHILRALAARWIGKPLADNPSLLLEAGGVGTLSYEHHRIDQPAILLGGAFMSDVVESAVEGGKKGE